MVDALGSGQIPEDCVYGPTLGDSNSSEGIHLYYKWQQSAEERGHHFGHWTFLLPVACSKAHRDTLLLPEVAPTGPESPLYSDSQAPQPQTSGPAAPAELETPTAPQAEVAAGAMAPSEPSQAPEPQPSGPADTNGISVDALHQATLAPAEPEAPTEEAPAMDSAEPSQAPQPQPSDPAAPAELETPTAPQAEVAAGAMAPSEPSQAPEPQPSGPADTDGISVGALHQAILAPADPEAATEEAPAMAPPEPSQAPQPQPSGPAAPAELETPTAPQAEVAAGARAPAPEPQPSGLADTDGISVDALHQATLAPAEPEAPTEEAQAMDLAEPSQAPQPQPSGPAAPAELETPTAPQAEVAAGARAPSEPSQAPEPQASGPADTDGISVGALHQAILAPADPEAATEEAPAMDPAEPSQAPQPQPSGPAAPAELETPTAPQAEVAAGAMAPSEPSQAPEPQASGPADTDGISVGALHQAILAPADPEAATEEAPAMAPPEPSQAPQPQPSGPAAPAELETPTAPQAEVAAGARAPAPEPQPSGPADTDGISVDALHQATLAPAEPEAPTEEAQAMDSAEPSQAPQPQPSGPAAPAELETPTAPQAEVAAGAMAPSEPSQAPEPQASGPAAPAELETPTAPQAEVAAGARAPAPEPQPSGPADTDGISVDALHQATLAPAEPEAPTEEAQAMDSAEPSQAPQPKPAGTAAPAELETPTAPQAEVAAGAMAPSEPSQAPEPQPSGPADTDGISVGALHQATLAPAEPEAPTEARAAGCKRACEAEPAQSQKHGRLTYQAIDVERGCPLDWETTIGQVTLSEGKRLGLMVQRKHAEKFLLPVEDRKLAEIRSKPVNFLKEGDQILLISTGDHRREAIAILEFQSCSKIMIQHFAKYESMHCVSSAEFSQISASWGLQGFCYAWHFELRVKIQPPLPIPVQRGPVVWLGLDTAELLQLASGCLRRSWSDSCSFSEQDSSSASYPQTPAELSEDGSSSGLVVRLPAGVLKNLEEASGNAAILVAFPCKPSQVLCLAEAGGHRGSSTKMVGRAVLYDCQQILSLSQQILYDCPIEE